MRQSSRIFNFPFVDTSRPLIAIVDDEESVRRALQRLMIAAGFRVQVFASGEELLSSLHNSHPNCVVLDLHMPGMSGFDVQVKLKNEPSHIPVVIITGHDTPESQQQVMSAGAIAYLRKPVDAQVLLNAVDEAISKATNGSIE